MRFHSFMRTLLVLLAFTVLLLAWYVLITLSHPIFQKNIQEKKKLSHNKCPNVLKYMTVGRWLPKDTNSFMKLEMDVFLEKARKDFYIPGTLQRPDDKCGNVTFDWIDNFLRPLLWFRALCDPKGEKPCCYNNECNKRTIEQCRCIGCYDMRQQINAEHATWKPDHRDCSVRPSNPQDICNVLDGITIDFIGDSFIRHLYMAFLMLVKGNMYDSALTTDNIPQLTHSKCVGMYVFSEAECRVLITFNTSLCHHTVQVNFLELAKIENRNIVLKQIQNLEHKPKTLVVIGIGIHDDYNSNATANQYLDPILRYRKSGNLKWPRLLWLSAHAPGLLKTPRVPEQSYDSVIRFNEQIRQYLNNWDVPVFDSFNLTDGVNSFDGAHYGVGVNLVKAHLLIEYVKELRTKQKCLQEQTRYFLDNNKIYMDF